MSANPPEKNSSTEPLTDQDLASELAELDELSGTKKFFLFLFVIATLIGLTWVILKYAVFTPESKAKSNREQSASSNDKQNSELEKLSKIQADKLKEENRLKRIQQNNIACEVAIKEQNWKLAEKYIGELQDDKHDIVETAKLQTRLEQGKDQERKTLIKVSTLLEQARELDKGEYSPEAIELLDQALALHPDHPESSDLRKKIDAYQSEFRIPEDYASIEEVMPKLRAGDTILLAKGTYNLSSILTIPVTIKGAGIGKTIIETDTTEHSALVFINENPEAGKTSKISDLTIQGTTYQDFNIDRYPLILVKSEVTIDNTLIKMSSGHGIAVLSGSLNLLNSEITTNGWDGISVRGEGAKAHISDCKIHTNYDHGVDFWENATGTIAKCEIYENSGSGIVVMGKKANVNITQVRSYKNEQCGIVVMDQASIELVRIVTASNVLSGIAVQGKGSNAKFGMVISNNNAEAGYYLDPASNTTGYEHTTSEGNAKGNLVRKALEFTIKRQAE